MALLASCEQKQDSSVLAKRSQPVPEVAPPEAIRPLVADPARVRIQSPSDEQIRLAQLLAESKVGGASWLKFLNEFRADPGDATARLITKSPGPRAYSVLQAVAAAISKDNPEFVRQWIEGLTGEPRAQVALGLIQVWARYAPDQVAQWISNDSAIFADARCQQILVANWAELNIRAAAHWSYGLPAGPARRSATQTLARVWGKEDSKSALETVSHIDLPSERDDFSVSLAEGWALRDAKPAVTWFLTAPLSDDARRTEPLYALFSDLADQDAVSAEQQLAAMPSGPNRDAAIRGFIDTLGAENPKQVIPWVSKITDDIERLEVVDELSETLAQSHPALVEQLKSIPGVGN